MLYQETLTYDDVLLVPQYSDIESRTEINISNHLDKNIKLEVPIISSPMDTVTESSMAIAISELGGLGIIHRYNSIEEQVAMVDAALRDPGCRIVGAAIGVTGDYEERAAALFEAGADVICLDVAHGHHLLMKNALRRLTSTLPSAAHIMAGNVATKTGYEALVDWGARSVRCNIGGGSICSTRIQTGHGIPGLQTIFECASAGLDIPIIADGGIKNSGDIAKALGAGADFVMLGSLLAGTDEAPGITYINASGRESKMYRGMASHGAQKDWRGRLTSAPEGVTSQIPYKGDVATVLRNLTMGVRSGFSYTGARTLPEFQARAKFVKQTGASQTESTAHILRGE